MTLIFKTILTGYLVLFLSLAQGYRSYLVFKSSGINTLKQAPEDASLKILAVTKNPNSNDANFFYAEFLSDQDEYKKALNFITRR